MNYGDTYINESGGKQSYLGRRFDLIPIQPLIAVSEILHRGAEKYGENNWHSIDRDDHLNHALNHIYLFLDGDRSENHLGNAICRLLFAYWADLNGVCKTTRIDVKSELIEMIKGQAKY